MPNHILKVQMFGGFRMTYGDEPISFERNTTTKTNQLLQILICAGDDGISREQLVRNLLGKENVSNPSNSLRITVFRLRKLFEEKMPGINPVVIENRRYFFNPEVETDVDIFKFKRLVKLGDESVEAGKYDLACDDYSEALNLYKGEFVPELSSEEWAIVENISYKNEYVRVLKKLSELLSDKGEYERLYKYVTAAASFYPYDDWQVSQMECLIHMNRGEEAIKIYDQTSNLLLNDLGVAPSEALVDKVKAIGNRFISKPGAIDEITEGIKEDTDEAGAYFSSYIGFLESYRFIRRVIERTGQSAFLVLITIVDGKGNPMQPGERLDSYLDEIMNATKKSLRKGDLYTQYSPNQLLLLLMEISKDDCDLVARRIKNNIESPNKRNGIRFEISTVADVEMEKDSFRFKNKNS
ncbi:MAG: hypothetical protein K6E13_09710 [Lachnospiraceae bacterium]|nr:hypothetical protein [Lachnospiraceae bacterium]